ncbi:MAG: YtxH domain-containing protein [Saprospiraceae bacterium]|nr:YtxH domain-containing protein [Saprospiraceae bacterium]
MGILQRIKSWFVSEPREDSGFSQRTDDFEIYSPTPRQPSSEVRAEAFADKAKEFISGTVDEVKQQGSALWDEVKEQAGNLEESTREFRENLKQKAQDAVEKVEDFVDKTLEKAKALEEQERNENPDKDGDGIADKPIDFGKDLKSGHPGFFEKAEAWLKENEGQKFNPEPDNSSKKLEPLELPNDPEEEKKTESEL